jgi:hypothetical protein
MIYFKTYARENGCPESVFKSDLAVWNWIREFQIVTIWECKEKEVWKHNHIEKGYDANATIPNSKFPNQVKAWKGNTWRNIEGHITCYHVVKEGKVQWTD